MGGTGTVRETINGKTVATLDVSGVPKLYTLVRGSRETQALMILNFSPNVEAYDFTFG